MMKERLRRDSSAALRRQAKRLRSLALARASAQKAKHIEAARERCLSPGAHGRTALLDFDAARAARRRTRRCSGAILAESDSGGPVAYLGDDLTMKPLQRGHA